MGVGLMVGVGIGLGLLRVSVCAKAIIANALIPVTKIAFFLFMILCFKLMIIGAI
jgi:hypothetical protein